MVGRGFVCGRSQAHTVADVVPSSSLLRVASSSLSPSPAFALLGEKSYLLDDTKLCTDMYLSFGSFHHLLTRQFSLSGQSSLFWQPFSS